MTPVEQRQELNTKQEAIRAVLAYVATLEACHPHYRPAMKFLLSALNADLPAPTVDSGKAYLPTDMGFHELDGGTTGE
jgi:hypothetical protein